MAVIWLSGFRTCWTTEVEQADGQKSRNFWGSYWFLVHNLKKIKWSTWKQYFFRKKSEQWQFYIFLCKGFIYIFQLIAAIVNLWRIRTVDYPMAKKHEGVIYVLAYICLRGEDKEGVVEKNTWSCICYENWKSVSSPGQTCSLGSQLPFPTWPFYCFGSDTSRPLRTRLCCNGNWDEFTD